MYLFFLTFVSNDLCRLIFVFRCCFCFILRANLSWLYFLADEEALTNNNNLTLYYSFIFFNTFALLKKKKIHNFSSHFLKLQCLNFFSETFNETKAKMNFALRMGQFFHNTKVLLRFYSAVVTIVGKFFLDFPLFLYCVALMDIKWCWPEERCCYALPPPPSPPPLPPTTT